MDILLESDNIQMYIAKLIAQWYELLSLTRKNICNLIG